MIDNLTESLTSRLYSQKQTPMVTQRWQRTDLRLGQSLEDGMDSVEQLQMIMIR